MQPSNTDDIVCIVVNYHSLKTEMIEFATVIEIRKPRVVFESEFWLDDTINNNENFSTFYTVYRRDRNVNGGVFIPIHNTIPSSVVDVEADSTKIVCFKVLLNIGSSMAFVFFYRPASSRTPF